MQTIPILIYILKMDNTFELFLLGTDSKKSVNRFKTLLDQAKFQSKYSFKDQPPGVITITDPNCDANEMSPPLLFDTEPIQKLSEVQPQAEKSSEVPVSKVLTNNSVQDNISDLLGLNETQEQPKQAVPEKTLVDIMPNLLHKEYYPSLADIKSMP